MDTIFVKIVPKTTISTEIRDYFQISGFYRFLIGSQIFIETVTVHKRSDDVSELMRMLCPYHFVDLPHGREVRFSEKTGSRFNRLLYFRF